MYHQRIRHVHCTLSLFIELWINGWLILSTVCHLHQSYRSLSCSSSSRYSPRTLSRHRINTSPCSVSSSLPLFLSLSLCVLHKQTSTCKQTVLFKQIRSFVPRHEWGSGGSWQQTARVQWIAARESINWGPCKWTEQGRNQLQSPAKSCLLTHLLKHAGKLTALDFNGMKLKPWRRWPETAKKTLAFFFSFSPGGW